MVKMDRCKDILCSWMGRINIVKMFILPKAIYRFHTISIKLLMAFLTRTRTKKIFNLYGNTKDPKYQNGAGKIRLPDFGLYYNATIIKTALYHTKNQETDLHKNRNTDLSNRIESPEINPHTQGQLTYDKGGKYTMEKRQSLQKVVLGKLGNYM